MNTKHNTCRGCGRQHEDERLMELQSVKRNTLRTEIRAGDKVRLKEDCGIVEKGSIGIVQKTIATTEDDVEKYVSVAFNPYKPFDLEKLKKYDALSISGGPIKRIPISKFEGTRETKTTKIHKHSPKFGGQTPPEVTILSKVWEVEP